MSNSSSRTMFRSVIALILLVSIAKFTHAQTQLTFNGTPTVSGTAGAVNTTCTYPNVGTTGGVQIRAVVTITAINGSAVLNTIDGTTGGTDASFQPIINGPTTASGSCFSYTFNISFFNNATSAPLAISFKVNGVDIDGDNGTLREFNEFDQVKSYTTETPTSLAITHTGNNYTFTSPQTQYAGISLTQTNVIVTVTYTSVTSINMTLGSCCVGGTCTATGTNRQTSLNFFDAIAYTTPSNTITTLPVTFTSIQGESLANGNRITWGTAEEAGVSKYEIERSTDGSTFATVGTASLQQGTGAKTYTYFDATPSRIYYYRIKSIDLDGKYAYSRTVKVGFKGAAQQLNLLSNPVSSSLEYKFVSTETQKLQVNVVDNTGRVLMSNKLQVRDGENYFQLSDLSKLSAGVYILSITDEKNNRYQEKFVKN